MCTACKVFDAQPFRVSWRVVFYLQSTESGALLSRKAQQSPRGSSRAVGA